MSTAKQVFGSTVVILCLIAGACCLQAFTKAPDPSAMVRVEEKSVAVVAAPSFEQATETIQQAPEKDPLGDELEKMRTELQKLREDVKVSLQVEELVRKQVDALKPETADRVVKISDLPKTRKPLPPLDNVPYVDESNLPEDDRHSEESGKKFPRIIIDGVKCRWDADRKSYVDAVFGCKVIWLQVGNDRQLMSHCDWRQGKDGQLQDGDVQIVFKPLQIRDHGEWRDMRDEDPIHPNAAKAFGLPENPERGHFSPIGKSLLWARFDGDTWRLVDSTKAPTTAVSENINKASN